MEYIRNEKIRNMVRMSEEEIMETVTLLMYVKGSEIRSIFEMRFRDVQDLKDGMTDGTMQDLINCVKIVTGKTEEEVLDMKVLSFFKVVNSIKAQLEEIAHAEETALSSNVPNFKWEAVGGSERMSKFGIYNTLEMLSGGDILKWEAILDLEYSDVFTKLYMMKEKAEIEHEMNTIKTHV